MDDGGLAPGVSARGDRHAQIEQWRVAARDCRRVWRWLWQRFWILRWENALRRPSWRVEEESRAWRRMRDEVRRYADIRLRIAALLGEFTGDGRMPIPRVDAARDSEFIN